MKSALWVIAQREYIQRVKTKGFVIGTLLGPIFMIALIAIPVFVMVAVDEQVTRRIAIVDKTGVLADALDFPVEFEMVQLDVPADTIRLMVEEQLLDGYLLLPADVLQGRGPASFYSRGGGGLMFSTQLQQVVDRAVRQRRLVDAGAPDAVLRILSESVDVRMVKLTDQGEEADAATALAGIGYVMGFVIYICMFIYGAFVMRGVIEEKTNRIAELIASSARPFQLMMGKVLGIGAMGLTQFLVWCILGMGIMAFGGAIVALFIDPAEYGLTETTNQQAVLDAAGVTIPQIPFSAFVLSFSFSLADTCCTPACLQP
jgi:ABC-2 type transport system permease protein